MKGLGFQGSGFGISVLELAVSVGRTDDRPSLG